MSLRNSAPLLPALTEGAHNCTLKEFSYFPATATASDGYQLALVLSDRIITERKFDQSFSISISHLRKQLNDDSTIQPTIDKKTGEIKATAIENWMTALVENKTKFNIYVENALVTKRDGTQANVRNINFLPALPKAKPVVKISDLADDLAIEV